MKSIAVISDVHANLEALQAVMARIDALGIDAVYSLGDTVGYGPDPEACLAIVRDRCRVRLMGNHENAVLYPSYARSLNPVALKAVEWTRERIAQAGLTGCIAGLQPFVREAECLFVHGSVRNPLHEYLLEADREGYSTFDEVVESLENDFVHFRLCFAGHNHKPFLATTEGFLHPHPALNEFQVPPDENLYVCTGSVGQPRDGDPRACFVTYDGMKVTYHRVEYPCVTTAEKIRAAGLPSMLADRLMAGR